MSPCHGRVYVNTKDLTQPFIPIAAPYRLPHVNLIIMAKTEAYPLDYKQLYVEAVDINGRTFVRIREYGVEVNVTLVGEA